MCHNDAICGYLFNFQASMYFDEKWDEKNINNTQ